MSAAAGWTRFQKMDGTEWWEMALGGYGLRAWADGRWDVCAGDDVMAFSNDATMFPDLPSAQTAAIGAATGLLVAALASVPCEPPEHWRFIEGWKPGIVTLGTPTSAHSVVGDDLVTLGHACIAAGVAARGGG